MSDFVSWTAPEDDFNEVDQDEPADVWALKEDGHVTQQDAVAEEDLLVWQIKSTSFVGTLEVSNDLDNANEDYTEALVSLLSPQSTINQNEIGSATGHPLSDDFLFRMYQKDTEGNFDPIEVDLKRRTPTTVSRSSWTKQTVLSSS